MVYALSRWGNWKKVEQAMPGRTRYQCTTHGQKYLESHTDAKTLWAGASPQRPAQEIVEAEAKREAANEAETEAKQAEIHIEKVFFDEV